MYAEFPRIGGDGRLDPDSSWGDLESAVRRFSGRLQVWVVANPMSGPGVNIDGSRVNEHTTLSYQWAVRRLKEAGARVLGYVATGWMGRAGQSVCTRWDSNGRCDSRATTGATIVSACQTHIDHWFEHYAVDGIFFDEVAVQNVGGRADGNAALAQRALATAGHASAPLAFNYGVPPETPLDKAPATWVFGQIENSERAFLASALRLRSAPASLALIHHASRPGTPGFARLVSRVEALGIQWLYATPKSEWNVAPEPLYFHELFHSLSTRLA